MLGETGPPTTTSRKEALVGQVVRLWNVCNRKQLNKLADEKVRKLGRQRKLVNIEPSYVKLGNCYDRLVLVDKKLRRFAEGGKKIVIGPWLSEVGFEVLYWIPFIEWYKKTFNLGSDRFLVISRGGCRDWYQGITDQYVDIFSLFSQSEYMDWSKRRLEVTGGGQKQQDLSAFDSEILTRAGKELNLSPSSFDVVHPQYMYNTFRFYWYGKLPWRMIECRTHIKTKTFSEKWDIDLPKDYTAVKFYFRPSFPDHQQNVDFCERVIRKLSFRRPVVLLNTGLNIDDHAEIISQQLAEEIPNVYSYTKHTTLENNLALQTYLVANAKLFVGTYGGFSYLAPFYGVPSVSVYSDRKHFTSAHLDLMHHFLRQLDPEGTSKIDFSALHVDMLERLSNLL